MASTEQAGEVMSEANLRLVFADEFKSFANQLRCDMCRDLEAILKTTRVTQPLALPSEELPMSSRKTQLAFKLKYYASDGVQEELDMDKFHEEAALEQREVLEEEKRISALSSRTSAWEESPDVLRESARSNVATYTLSDGNDALGDRPPNDVIQSEEQPTCIPSSNSISNVKSKGNIIKNITSGMNAQSLEKALGITARPQRSSVAIFGPEVGEISRIEHFRIKLKVLVLSTRFELITLSLIILNGFYVGYQTNELATTDDYEITAFARFVEIFFCVIFTLEIAIRLYALRCKYFTMWGCGWNIFDLLLVLVQIAEELIKAAVGSHDSAAEQIQGVPSDLLRVTRVLRVVKVVRVLRIMRFAEDLRLLVSCIMYAFKPFFWAFTLLFFIIFVVSTYYVNQVTIHCHGSDITPENEDVLKRWYGSVPRAMLSLFQGLTSGVDWNELLEPLLLISPWFGVAYFAFNAFAILALMNVVTGIFVQSAIDRANEVKEINRVSRARKMFAAMDLDSSGNITWEEMMNHLEAPAVQEYFRSIGVDEHEAVGVFEVLDYDDSGVITLDEFLSGCMRLQGPTRNFDLLNVARENKRAFDQQAAMLQAINERLGLSSLPGRTSKVMDGNIPSIVPVATNEQTNGS